MAENDHGTEEAFEVIFRQYSPAIYNYTLRIMGKPEDAADLTQETFLKAFVALGKSSKEVNLKPWLYRIATNACIDELRRRKRLQRQPWEAIVAMFESGPADSYRPEEQVVLREDRELVRQTLERLTASHRIILLLREYQDLSYEEMAGILDKSVGAVKSLLFRAREEFRQTYLELQKTSGTT